MRTGARVIDGDGPRAVRYGWGGTYAGHLRRYALRLPFAAVILASIMTPAALVWAQNDAIESHKQDLADIEGRVSGLEQDLNEHRDRRQGLLAELERQERHIADLARAGHQLATMIDEQERALDELRDQSTAEQQALRRERAALGSLLRSVYAMGRGDRIRMLLDQEDPKRLSRVTAYYGFFNRYRLKRIEAVTQRAHKLDGLMQEAEEEKARLLLLAGKQEETRARLAAAQDERTALLTAMEQAIATRAQDVTELNAQAQEMRLLLEQLERQALVLPEAELRQKPLKQLRGHLAWPLAGAPLLSRFGNAKEDGTQRWDGVLLGAAEGSEVQAVHHGQVVYADWLRGFGLLLIIEHDDEYMTLYGHNQTLLKEPGEWVVAGDTIALSGSSGGHTSPGLYFAIRHRGRPLNPEQWCRRPIHPGRRSSAISAPRVERIQISLLQPPEPVWTADTPFPPPTPMSESIYQ